MPNIPKALVLVSALHAAVVHRLHSDLLRAVYRVFHGRFGRNWEANFTDFGWILEAFGKDFGRVFQFLVQLFLHFFGAHARNDSSRRTDFDD